MPRPRKCRKVCSLPETAEFCPRRDRKYASDAGVGHVCESAADSVIIMTVDEYETIRLIDQEGVSQEECSEQMQVARTTVQQIYTSARRKLAQMLVEGRPLRIEGGDYRMCDGREPACRRTQCRRTGAKPMIAERTGGIDMKVAVTYDNGQIFQHFGHTEQFKIYEVTDGKITASRVVDTNGSGHGALAGFLMGLGVDVLICGGIGGGAQMALAQIGVKLYAGVAGDTDAAVEALAAGTLVYQPDVTCSHHHGEHHNCSDHHGEGHGGNCGHHGAGHEGGCGHHGGGCH